jgi:hypothetical protein
MPSAASPAPANTDTGKSQTAAVRYAIDVFDWALFVARSMRVDE